MGTIEMAKQAQQLLEDFEGVVRKYLQDAECRTRLIVEDQSIIDIAIRGNAMIDYTVLEPLITSIKEEFSVLTIMIYASYDLETQDPVLVLSIIVKKK